jgi:hypothetical protein
MFTHFISLDVQTERVTNERCAVEYVTRFGRDEGREEFVYFKRHTIFELYVKIELQRQGG